MSARQDPAGYERSDADVRPLVTFLVGLAVLIVVTFFLAAWLLGSLDEARTASEEPHPMEGFQPRPSGPLLQPSPAVELVEQRRYEEELLGEYAWVDPQDGIVRMPIERAIDLVLERGLPELPEPESPEPESPEPESPEEEQQ